MNITLQVLGSGDAFGSGGKMNTCFYIKTAETNFLVDCGGTALVAMKKYAKNSSDDIDAIFLTHFHGDHIGGIPFFLCEAKNYFNRKKDFYIFGPKGVEEKVNTITNAMYPGTTANAGFKIKYNEVQAEKTFSFKNLNVEYFKVKHSPTSSPHGIRIQIAEKILGFSGDTEWTENLIKISNGADFFICECNNLEKKGKFHMDHETLKYYKEKFTCKRMVINHLSVEPLSRINEIEFEVAEEGKVYHI
jgi:ribonuclease BN (tRNA processing enzyme)